jgi:hypothetical protein
MSIVAGMAIKLLTMPHTLYTDKEVYLRLVMIFGIISACSALFMVATTTLLTQKFLQLYEAAQLHQTVYLRWDKIEQWTVLHGGLKVSVIYTVKSV